MQQTLTDYTADEQYPGGQENPARETEPAQNTSITAVTIEDVIPSRNNDGEHPEIEIKFMCDGHERIRIRRVKPRAPPANKGS
jgi:hypothetical protein